MSGGAAGGRRPIIGVTVSCHPNPRDAVSRPRLYVAQSYCDLLHEYGAEPLLIPIGASAGSVLPVVRGLLFPGGDDFDSAIWGEMLHPEAQLEHPGRFELERDLFMNRERSVPVLGICYGCQSIALMHGGSLIQHLPDDPKYLDHKAGIQEYQVEAGSRLGAILGSESARGESRHHQGIGNLGEGLRASAFAEDGLIEGLETLGDDWVIGVQWHPESTPDEPTTKALFHAFVTATR